LCICAGALTLAIVVGLVVALDSTGVAVGASGGAVLGLVFATGRRKT
jgi:hypothetical protein